MLILTSAPYASPIRLELRTTRDVCTPHPIIWAEYSAMNLATGSKDSFLLMSYFLYMNRILFRNVSFCWLKNGR